jgi:hypothetical protein
VDKEGNKIYPDFKNAVSFKLVKGEDFKKKKEDNKLTQADYEFKFSTLEIKEASVNLDKLIEKIRENKLDLTEENKKELYELSKGL